ncbi:nucleolar protein 10-like [Oscarella lobularis]|uniref:nucleolar protein 10-like n=1 Tax=Oscarella lobularis TaxID=121494 RepID=UPI0033141413
MEVSNPNDVKIYSLSAGKTLPEWISERQRRALQKSDIEIRRRIQLIQDFEMPTASTRIKVSRDGQYIIAGGTYKPRIRCYDVNQLSLKFERCLDMDVQQFQILSEDYSKLAILGSDRSVEFHVQYGRYYKTRIPKFGRDMAYHYPSCDLYVVGTGPEIYRLNLDIGRFQSASVTEATGLNVCCINPEHQLLAVGSEEGCVECWDPRSQTRVGSLDVGLAAELAGDDAKSKRFPSITSLSFKGALTMGVATDTGQILIYDIRSNHPLLTKDHQYGLPINTLRFLDQSDLVLSADTKIIKIWNGVDGSPVTSVEPPADVHEVCMYPNSGLMFVANEAPRIQSYYIPSLGIAPRWCSFLDSLAEELEENPQPEVYDDYKFVTSSELESLGLTHLLGTKLLRAYMHGYFIDIRLYRKAKSIAEPFAYEEYRKKKIQDKLDEDRASRVQLKKLPKVNKELAQKLLDEKKMTKSRTASTFANPLGDERFSQLFTDPSFQVDVESEAFKLVHPSISKRDKKRQKEAEEEKRRLEEQFEQIEDDEVEGKASEEESSSDEDEEEAEIPVESKTSKPRFYEIKPGEEFLREKTSRKLRNAPLEERMKTRNEHRDVRDGGKASGDKTGTLILAKKSSSIAESERRRKDREHREERRLVRRSAKGIVSERGGARRHRRGGGGGGTRGKRIS